MTTPTPKNGGPAWRLLFNHRYGLLYFFIHGLRTAWVMDRDCGLGFWWSIRFQWRLAWVRTDRAAAGEGVADA